jgi:glycosyltransferase involved in cell wall biosynthesis
MMATCPLRTPKLTPLHEVLAEARHRRHLGQLQVREQALFDFDYYSEQIGLVFDTREDAFGHYRIVGAAARVSPHPLFDPSYYHRLYADVQHVDDLFQHFLGSGDAEMRRPHPLFEPNYYLEEHLDAGCGAGVTTGWQHFLECPRVSVVPTPLWAPVVEEAADSDEHALAGREGLLRYLRGETLPIITPNPLFDERYVRRRCSDVERSLALVHYASRVGDERNDVAPNLFFDQAWYIESQGEGLDWYDCPLSQYLRMDERRPSHPAVLPDVWRRVTGSTWNLASVMLATRWSTSRDTWSVEQAVDALIVDIDSAAITCVSALLAHRSAEHAATTIGIRVLDNASTSPHEAQELADYLPFARVSRIDRRRSFGESNNLLFENGQAELVLLLNNDAFIPDAGLACLLGVAHSRSDTVAIGPMFIYPDGRVQEAGGRFCDDGSPIQLGKGRRTLPPQLAQCRSVDYISAACLLVRRDAFLKAGGFSYIFEPAYFEDTDLCLRLQQLGEIVVVPDVQVVHYEGHTTGRREVLSDKLAIQSLAREKFTAVFDRRQRTPARVTPRLPMSPSGRRRAVLYSAYGLMLGGGEKYLLSLANVLDETWDVLLAFDGPYSQLRLGNIQEALGLPTRSFALVDVGGSPPRWPQADLFVVMANSLLPPVPAVGEVNVYHCQFPFPHPNDLALGTRQELSGWDEIVVNSEFTATHYRRKAQATGADPTVRVLAPPCAMLPFSTCGDALTVVNVGRFFASGHSKKQDAAIRAFAQLLSVEPEARLSLIGGVAADEDSRAYFQSVLELARELPVEMLPDATREELVQRVGSSSFLWHLAGLGVGHDQPEKMEHFGISVVEAMSAGVVPIVSDRGGPADIVAKLDERLCVSSLAELVDATLRVWRDAARFAALKERAHELAKEYSTSAFTDAARVLSTRAHALVDQARAEMA